jgi:O-6-methylguanine DNA methyltransferase
MILEIKKSKFNSKIGVLYYLWLADEDNNERIVFLSNNEEEFNQFLNIIFKKNNPSHKKNLTKNQKSDGTVIYSQNLQLSGNKSSKIENAITDYLSGKSKVIDIKPYFLTGSVFLKNVWNHALLIPYGTSISYKELACMAGCPLAWRAVGTAMKKNPVMLVVPCHRVIKSNGDIGNYGGGVKIKKFLLDLESARK